VRWQCEHVCDATLLANSIFELPSSRCPSRANLELSGGYATRGGPRSSSAGRRLQRLETPPPPRPRLLFTGPGHSTASHRSGLGRLCRCPVDQIRYVLASMAKDRRPKIYCTCTCHSNFMFATRRALRGSHSQHASPTAYLPRRWTRSSAAEHWRRRTLPAPGPTRRTRLATLRSACLTHVAPPPQSGSAVSCGRCTRFAGQRWRCCPVERRGFGATSRTAAVRMTSRRARQLPQSWSASATAGLEVSMHSRHLQAEAATTGAYARRSPAWCRTPRPAMTASATMRGESWRSS
jgi:hypothetical protein